MTVFTKFKQKLIVENPSGIFKCHYCGCDIVLRKGMSEMHLPDDFTIDHFIPKCMGGLNSRDNLKFCCRQCNEERGKIGSRDSIWIKTDLIEKFLLVKKELNPDFFKYIFNYPKKRHISTKHSYMIPVGMVPIHKWHVIGL